MAKPISAVLERHLGRKDGLPLRESAVFQIGPGRAAFDTLQVCGRDVIVIRLKVAPKLAGYVVPDPEWLVVMIPLVWTADYIFNGRVAERGDAFLSVGTDGYSTVGSDRDTVAIGVRKPVALEACAGLSGLHPEDISFDDIVLSGRTRPGRHLTNGLRYLTENPLAAPVAAGCFALEEDRERDLIDMLAQALLPYVAVRSIGESLNMEALRIVRRAEEASRRIPARPLSLSELCREAGVSRTWLHRCFHEVYGLSPVQCARRWRMSAVRERLLDHDRDGTLVKEVALQYGFSHSGRFGSEFRAVFGEYPSQTLLRGLQGDKA